MDPHEDGETSTCILTDDQLAVYQPWFDNHRHLRELITELEELSVPGVTSLWARSAPGSSRAIARQDRPVSPAWLRLGG